jgi:hypothetical protein
MMTPRHQTRLAHAGAPWLLNRQTLAKRFTVILLLFTLAGLFTLAKTGQYYPESNPAQHVSVSIKMNVTHPSLKAVEEPRQSLICFLPPQPPPRPQRVQSKEPSPIVPVGVTVSMQHRSPPLALV